LQETEALFPSVSLFHHVAVEQRNRRKISMPG
jgi:hypothetical protein